MPAFPGVKKMNGLACLYRSYWRNPLGGHSTRMLVRVVSLTENTLFHCFSAGQDFRVEGVASHSGHKKSRRVAGFHHVPSESRPGV